MSDAVDPVFRFHKELMSSKEINFISRYLNPLIKDQKITVIDLGEWQKKSVSRKRRPADSEYSPEFLEFWEGCPNKIGKGSAAIAFEKAIKAGYRALTIISGLQTFIQYEKGRKGQEGYKPLHPATWLNGKRWQDEPGADLSKPRQTPLDIACVEIGKQIGGLVQGVERNAVQECLEAGMTGPEILKHLKDLKPADRLERFLYELSETINKGIE